MNKPKIVFGEKAEPIGVPRFRGDDGSSAVLCFDSRRLESYDVTYVPGIGMFHSTGSDFERETFTEVPQRKFVFPVIHYSGDMRNYGPPVAVYYFLGGLQFYETLLTKGQIVSMQMGCSMEESLSLVDMNVHCIESRYQKFQLDILGEARWRKDPAITQTVETLLKEYDKLIDMSVAKRFSVEQLMSMAEKVGLVQGRGGFSGPAFGRPAPHQQYQQILPKLPVVPPYPPVQQQIPQQQIPQQQIPQQIPQQQPPQQYQKFPAPSQQAPTHYPPNPVVTHDIEHEEVLGKLFGDVSGDVSDDDLDALFGPDPNAK